MIDALPVGGLASQLARHSRCVAADDAVLTLQLDEKAAEVNTDAAREKLQDGLRDLLSQPRLTLHIETGELQGHTRATADAQAEDERQKAAELAVENDSNVQAFKQRFDATVRPGSVIPLDS